ncbi:MAG TPA: hypothetical protein P5058_02290 [Eubacteriales bacterium]|nr:hypothetical protein [Eubacteriales bacterium]
MKKFFVKFLIVAIALVLLAGILMLSGCSKHVKEDTVYYIDLENSSIWHFGLLPFLDPASSITLRKDGTLTIKLILSQGAVDLVNGLLPPDFFAGLDLSSAFETMICYMFPGLDVNDALGLFTIAREKVGLNVHGLDDIAGYITENGRFPDNFVLPSDVYIEYTDEYYIEKVKSPYSGEYTGIFVGESDGTEPFLIMTQSKDRSKLRMRVEFIKIELNAVLAD